MRHARAHVGVHADAAHVVVRDRRHFDRLAREVDAVRREAVDHRTERHTQVPLVAMLEREPGAAVRRAAAFRHLLENRVGR